MMKVLGLIIALLVTLLGLFQVFDGGHFFSWLTKKGSGSTSPFVMASLGSGFYIGILLAVGGLVGVVSAITSFFH